VQPELLIVDSIQTIYKSDIESAPGSVSQVRECSATLMRLAKSHGVTTFIIGHVTKDGNLAGPRVLEHIVDTVLFFEGERSADFRVLRAIKNRFGATSEIGLFEMRDKGLVDVPDASKLFLPDKADDIGSVIVPTVEGTRPLLVEIQALVAPTPFMPPRRTSDSVDVKKIQLLLAVLEKRLHLAIGSCDVYMKTAGGIKIDEPATDLPMTVALASSFANRKLLPQCVIFGEVGLSGEIRAVSKARQRVDESVRMGFTNIILPKKNFSELKTPPNVNLFPVENLRDALKIAMPRTKENAE
jgi:DNA repair protein RadA/Sms